MSTRLYVGNLPQNFDQKELEGLFAAVGAGVRFKAVLDRETGSCRGFGDLFLGRLGGRFGTGSAGTGGLAQGAYE